MNDDQLKKQYYFFLQDYKAKFNKNRKRIVWEAFVAGYQVGRFDQLVQEAEMLMKNLEAVR